MHLELPVGKEFVYESFIGTKFYGMIQSETKVGDFDAIVLRQGGAYLCGRKPLGSSIQTMPRKGFRSS